MSPFTKVPAIDITGLSVSIGIPTMDGYLPYQTVQSLLETAMALQARGIRFEVKVLAGCAIVQFARTYIAADFLNSGMDRLFMIDGDIQWKADDFLRLLALSTKMDVVCATYPVKRDSLTFMLGTGDTNDVTLNEWGCFPVSGAGGGFVVAGRNVIQALADKAPLVKFSARTKPIPYLFRCDVVDGEARGEDMAFFSDVRQAGYQVHLDPAVSLGHVGMKMYTGSIMDVMQRV